MIAHQVVEVLPPRGRAIGGPIPGAQAHEAGDRRIGGRVREVDEVGVAHQRARLGVLEDEAQFRCGQTPVDRHRHRAEVVGGEDRGQELGAVVRQQAYDVARGHTPRLQPGGQRGGPVDHPLVGDGAVAVDRERLIGRARRVVLEHAQEAEVGLGASVHPRTSPYGAAYPPSTTNAVPVVQRAASLARYE